MTVDPVETKLEKTPCTIGHASMVIRDLPSINGYKIPVVWTKTGTGKKVYSADWK
jgi:type 1 glutamine amidotransferase